VGPEGAVYETEWLTGGLAMRCSRGAETSRSPLPLVGADALKRAAQHDVSLQPVGKDASRIARYEVDPDSARRSEAVGIPDGGTAMSTLSDKSGYRLTRRRFLVGAPGLAAASLLAGSRLAGAEPPPETTRIRLTQDPAICLAPQYLAEELLRLEGFAEIEYAKVPTGAASSNLVATGAADIKMLSVFDILPVLDTEQSVVVLAGIHLGCYELFGNDRVHAIRDLKRKTVAVSALGAGDHLFVASMLAYVGIDLGKDIDWVMTKTYAESMRLFTDGTADAFLAFPPQPQELRAKKIGNVIIDTTLDRPWSQYFCCVVAANRQFVAKHPIATKRALRALLKAADICAREPERVARFLVAKGYEPRYAMALDVLQKLPYNRWRDTNPEDTIRFYTLRLHEVGMIKSTPQKLIAQSTDWRFLNDLKRELKA
jgi:NitT/TauT family transport system substrate-binding protein